MRADGADRHGALAVLGNNTTVVENRTAGEKNSLAHVLSRSKAADANQAFPQTTTISVRHCTLGDHFEGPMVLCREMKIRYYCSLSSINHYRCYSRRTKGRRRRS